MASQWQIPKWPNNVRRRPGRPRPPHPHQSVAIVTRWTVLGIVLAAMALWSEASTPRLLAAITLACLGGLWGVLRADRVSDSDQWQKRHK